MTIPSVTESKENDYAPLPHYCAQRIIDHGDGWWDVPSGTTPGISYLVNLERNQCSCKGFAYRNTCSHLRDVEDLLSEHSQSVKVTPPAIASRRVPPANCLAAAYQTCRQCKRNSYPVDTYGFCTSCALS